MADLSSDYTRIEVASSENTKAYCWTAGKKENPPLLLVPGFTGTHTDLMAVANGLTEKYFVIVPDFPGWGESPRFPQGLTIENYADYIKSLIEQLKIDKIAYAGHCMGATVGIEFAKKFPENIKDLFLLSAPNLGGTLSDKLLILMADSALHFPKKIRPLFYLWRNRYTCALANIFVIRCIGKMKKLKLIMHYVLVQGDANEDSIEEAWISLIHYDYKKIADVKAPVHIVHGNEDVLINKKQVEKLRGFLPTATVDYVMNSGHMPPVENPKGVAEAILKY
jgi:pimeloyl-ACP methyl ester carboxylesterase